MRLVKFVLASTVACAVVLVTLKNADASGGGSSRVTRTGGTVVSNPPVKGVPNKWIKKGVNGVSKAAKATVKGVKAAPKVVSKGIKKGVNGVSKAAKATVKGVKAAPKVVSKGIKKGVNGVSKAAKATKKFFKKVF